MIHTHPSSGRVDNVRSFHSAQKASRRSWFSSDTRQLSSEVAMIPSCSLCSAGLLQSPLNSPLLPLLQGLFSAPLASDAISRAKTHWGWWGSEFRVGVGIHRLRLPPGQRSASKASKMPRQGLGSSEQHLQVPGTLQTPSQTRHVPSLVLPWHCPLPCRLPLVGGGQQLVGKQNRRSRN